MFLCQAVRDGQHGRAVSLLLGEVGHLVVQQVDLVFHNVVAIPIVVYGVFI